MDKEKIKALCEEIATQDNRRTQYPIYQVLELLRERANPEDGDAYEVWYDEEGYIGKVGEVDRMKSIGEEERREFFKNEFNSHYEFDTPSDNENMQEYVKRLQIDLDDYIESYDTTNNTGKTYMKDIRRAHHDNFFFTEKQAQLFLDQNAHNMVDPVIYTVSAYRNEQAKFIIHTMFGIAEMEVPRFWK